MTFIRDIAPWEKMQSRSRENRVSYSDIAVVLEENDGSIAKDIAEELRKNEQRVLATLQQMEISGKVVPKICRTAEGRECCYYLNPDNPTNETPSSSRKTFQKREPLNQFDRKQKRKYFPPFYDQNGRTYYSRKEIQDAFGVSNASITRWLRTKRLKHSGMK